MKKWIDRKWEELRAGDVIRWQYQNGKWSTYSDVVVHIGSRYAKMKKASLINGCNVIWTDRYKYQRLEEVEPPDGWYLVEFNECEYIRYKRGKYMCKTSWIDSKNKGLDWEEYTFLKRVEFKDIDEE